ncbi:hypothetical protein ACFUMH_13075 [Cellulomonas sp. NPDC057328]|uniref:hypothetical protein n=1 Tax=Cellulomonas sp. NPDC057328 TaxID=3346101 RepID=UPI00363B5324
MGLAELLARATESDALCAAVDAADPTDVAAALALADHDDPRVRRLVASVIPLLTHGDPPTDAMVAVLLRLTADVEADVRDHACFALGTQLRDVDTSDVRDALAARLDDIHRDTRSEALVGLAYRQDPRAFPRVRDALSRPDGQVWTLEVVAAGALGDPRLHELVLRHVDGWGDVDAARPARAAARLTDPAWPDAELVDGVARLYRRRARGWPEGDAVSAWRPVDDVLDMAPSRAGDLFDAVLARLAGDEAAERLLREESALAQLAAEGGHGPAQRSGGRVPVRPAAP